MKELENVVRALKEGNEEAFRELYERTNKTALSVIRRYCDEARDYEDILQETYLKVYRSIGDLQDAEKAQAWINKIAANTAIRFNMKKKPKLFAEMADEEGKLPEFEDETVSVNPEAIADRKAVSEIVLEVMKELPEDQRDALWMVYGQKITIREMAESLGVSENTIKSRLFQGKKKLLEKKDRFRKLGIDLRLVPVGVLIGISFEETAYAAAGAVAAGAAKAAVETVIGETAATGAAESAAASAASGTAGTAASAAAETIGTAAASAVSAAAGTSAVSVGMSLGAKAAVAVLAAAMTVGGGAAAAAHFRSSESSQEIASGHAESAEARDPLKWNSAESESAAGNSPEQAEALVSSKESMELLSVEQEHVGLYHMDPESFVRKASVQFFKLYLSEESAERYPALSAYLEEYNRETEVYYADALEALSGECDAMAEMQEAENGFVPPELSEEVSAKVVRADSAALGVQTGYFSYTGGAHGMYYHDGLNLDTASGRELRLSEVVRDTEGFKAFAKERLLETYREAEEEIAASAESWFAETELDGDDVLWLLQNDAVTLYFAPYTLGSYALGELEVNIYFDEAPELFYEKYTEAPEEVIVPFPSDGAALYRDIDGDGSKEALSLRLSPDSYGYMEEASVLIGETEVPLAGSCYEAEAYLIYADEKAYVYVFTVGDSDVSVLHVINAEDGIYDGTRVRNAALWTDSLYAEEYVPDTERWSNRKPVFNDPMAFMLSERFDTLGTMTAVKRFSVGKDGYPVSGDPYYALWSNSPVCALQEVPCALVNEAGEVLSGDALIPEGSFLLQYRTDGESMIDLILLSPEAVEDQSRPEYDFVHYSLKEGKRPEPENDADLQIFRVNYDTSQYPYRINGIPEEEFFEGMMYAG